MGEGFNGASGETGRDWRRILSVSPKLSSGSSVAEGVEGAVGEMASASRARNPRVSGVVMFPNKGVCGGGDDEGPVSVSLGVWIDCGVSEERCSGVAAVPCRVSEGAFSMEGRTESPWAGAREAPCGCSAG